MMLVSMSFHRRTLIISSDGEVFGRGGKRLSKYFDKDGYEYVLVSIAGKRRKLLVHRLVANAFLPNDNNLPQVNHKDGNKANNEVDNLEWITNSENQMHNRYVLGNITGFRDVPVICVETGKKYKSTREAWRDTGAGYPHISECIRGKRKTAGGYHWREAISSDT